MQIVNSFDKETAKIIETLSQTLGKKVCSCEFKLPYKEVFNTGNINGTNIQFDEYYSYMNEVEPELEYIYAPSTYFVKVVNLPLKTLEVY